MMAWTWQAHLYLLGESTYCSAWLHESCRDEAHGCVCRCHGRRYAESVVRHALEVAA